MSQESNIDLEVLARPAAAPPAPRRRWVWSLIPLVVLAGFAWVLLDQARDMFREAVPVQLVRPRAVQAGAGGAVPGSLVFQASGWVEPDPFPVQVTALAAGVIAEMLVEESDPVKKGQAVCRLVDDDARLAVQQAQADLARAKADLQVAEVEAENATEVFDAAIETTYALDTARALRASRQAELRHRQAAVAETQAAVEVARADLATQKYLAAEGAQGPWQVELAEARLKEVQAQLATRAADTSKAEAELAEAEAGLVRASRNSELRLEDRLLRARTKALVARAKAQVAQAAATLATAELRLSRMTVRSPIDGLVLSRHAEPGTIVGPERGPSDLMHVYDPKRLRVRVDVPQAQVAQASVGQRAEVRCDVRRGKPFSAEVIRIIETADIQKVTLEVQVRILDPDPLLKPEMLCQVAVFAAADPQADPEPTASHLVAIPPSCLVGTDGVWVVGGNGKHAELRRVEIASRTADAVVVRKGLNLADKVIANNHGRLREGALIHAEESR